MALASTVTASATPVRRTNPPSGTECTANAQQLYCCTSGAAPLNSFGFLGTLIHGLLGINLDAVVALDCTLSALAFCSQGTATCCVGNNQQQTGLVNVQLGCVIPTI
ncbi:hypothetical protein EDB85DRAFT_2297576 [Lactarius pseudohatsudake]|nr:hypothetical protein EDB85DRAFT_2297576 [Lactarius pseudohatsudake]